VAVGGLTTSINAALRDASLSAATRAQIEIRPVTEISMPESVLARARATPGVLAAAGTVEASTFIRASQAKRRVPSGLNATLVTMSVCPLRARTSWPLSASHTFAVLS